MIRFKATRIQANCLWSHEVCLPMVAIFHFDWPFPSWWKWTPRSHQNKVFFPGFLWKFSPLGGVGFLGRPKWKFNNLWNLFSVSSVHQLHCSSSLQRLGTYERSGSSLEVSIPMHGNHVMMWDDCNSNSRTQTGKLFAKQSEKHVKPVKQFETNAKANPWGDHCAVFSQRSDSLHKRSLHIARLNSNL